MPVGVTGKTFCCQRQAETVTLCSLGCLQDVSVHSKHDLMQHWDACITGKTERVGQSCIHLSARLLWRWSGSSSGALVSRAVQ